MFLLIFALFILILSVLYSYFKDCNPKYPPRARIGLPFFGPLIKYNQDPEAFIRWGASKVSLNYLYLSHFQYGSVYRLNLGLFDTVVVTDAQMIKEMAKLPESTLSFHGGVERVLSAQLGIDYKEFVKECGELESNFLNMIRVGVSSKGVDSKTPLLDKWAKQLLKQQERRGYELFDLI